MLRKVQRISPAQMNLLQQNKFQTVKKDLQIDLSVQKLEKTPSKIIVQEFESHKNTAQTSP